MQAYKDGKRDHEQMIEAAAGLGDTEFKDLAAHYAQQEPVQRNTRVPFSTAEWVQRCERCHGIDGNSTDPRFPMLAGQNENYLRKAMQAYSKGGRSASVMHAMSEPLSESDIQRIARHYAAQAPKPVVYVQLPCEQPPTE
jgi:cytochrome c553